MQVVYKIDSCSLLGNPNGALRVDVLYGSGPFKGSLSGSNHQYNDKTNILNRHIDFTGLKPGPYFLVVTDINDHSFNKKIEIPYAGPTKNPISGRVFAANGVL
ncbi:MAG: hypothetical protein HC896_15380 [Bacteroidales bacterium]|nr:hypothetical protein [Bacteroidales bacterium]